MKGKLEMRKLSNTLLIITIILCMVGCGKKDRPTAEEVQNGTVTFNEGIKPIGDAAAEDTDTTDNAFTDIKELMGISIEEANALGLHRDPDLGTDDSTILTDEAYTLMLTYEGEKMVGISVSEGCAYPFYGIYMGDSLSSAQEILEDEYEIIGADIEAGSLIVGDEEKHISIWLGNSSLDSDKVESIEINLAADVEGQKESMQSTAEDPEEGDEEMAASAPEKEPEPEVTEEPMEIVQVSGDLDRDIRDGLLYADENGLICNENKNPLPQYTDIMVGDNGALMDREGYLDGYEVTESGKIEFKYEDTGNVLRASGSESDPTGRYQCDGLYIDLIVEGDTASYMFENPDAGFKESEQDCFVENGYVYGMSRTLQINYENGTIGDCDGMGRIINRYVKVSNNAEVDLNYVME